MASINSKRDRITVAIIGLPPHRVKSLCSALEQIEPGRFEFLTIHTSLADIKDSDQVNNAVVLAGIEGLPERQSLLTAAQRLRTDLFYWEPLHLFLRTPPQRTGAEQDWAIHFHKLPPEDVRGLAEALCNSDSVSPNRRVEIIWSALVRLAHELGLLLRSLDPNAAVEPDTVRNSVQNVQSELATVGRNEAFETLRAELMRLERVPKVSEQDLDVLTPLVVSAETWARKSNGPERLRIALHKLSNDLRRARWRPEAAVEVAKRIRSFSIELQKQGLNSLPKSLRSESSNLCKAFNPLIQSVLDGRQGDLHKQLTPLLSQLHELARRLETPRDAVSYGVTVERIVVVEDDPDWRRLIIGVLKSMVLSVKVQEADTVAEAQRLLEEPLTSLVLVDLGLPVARNSEVILDAGLSLIKRFTGTEAHGKRLRHRFVVLTAAENYADAVRAALGLGISPASYLQKDPQTWESELRAQVRLAMQPPFRRLVNIEVFKRTGRIARVEGLEVKLDYPQWCLLAVFAESWKQAWCHTDAIARILANEPYSLDPESRGGDTDSLDPKDRIKRQLPHYISDLRAKLTEVYTQATHQPPPFDFIDFDDETSSYRLKANAQILDRVDEHYRIGHRPSVLVIEDNQDWGQEIVEELNRQGFDPRWAQWTDGAWQMLEEKIPDLLSLDLELPTTEAEWLKGQADANNAVEFLYRLRQDCPDLPVAILTAIPWQDSVMLEILRNGVRVSDYLSKHWQEPILRLAGSLARLWQEAITQSRILDWDITTPMHPIEIDPQTGMLASVAGYYIQTAGKSRKIILKLLSETPNIFVSRTELIDAVYPDPDGWPDDIDNALDLHVSRIRRAITTGTQGTIPGHQVICGDRGILWLRGIVQ